jgi:hypothetical protein
MAAFDRAGGEHSAGDLARRMVAERDSFDLVLLDGTRWSCALQEYGERELLVETETGLYLVPWHSVQYVVLEDKAPGDAMLLTAMEEVPALQEFMDEPPTEAVATEPSA